MDGLVNTQENKQKSRTYEMASVGVMTALMCVLGPLAVPIGAVPITLTNLVVYLAVYLLGGKWGTISYGIYLVLGICGLPVFSGGTGGLAKLAGPTGGYLVGFVFMALITGLVIERVKYQVVISIIGMIVATMVAYLFGTVWFVLQAGCTVAYALGVCVFPFLIGDFVKIIFAAVFGRGLRGQLKKAGLR